MKDGQARTVSKWTLLPAILFGVGLLMLFWPVRYSTSQPLYVNCGPAVVAVTRPYRHPYWQCGNFAAERVVVGGAVTAAAVVLLAIAARMGTRG